MRKHLKQLNKLFTSNILLLTYLLGLFFLFLYPSFRNYFVGDDFSWLRWAATSQKYTLILNFVDAQGFFFRPIPKLLIFLEYYFFGFNQYPYHVINLLFNYITSVGAFFLFLIIFKKKNLAFLGSILFSFIPSHSQDLYWIATISTTVSSAFVLFGLITYYLARTKDNAWYYTLSFLLLGLSIFTYENTIIFVGLMALIDVFFIKWKHLKNASTKLFPYFVSGCVIGIYLALRHFANAAGFSGDYNYNLAKVIPNSVGNFLGYVLLFFSGENSLSMYNFTRENLRIYSLQLTIIGCFLLAFAGGFFLEHKEKIRLGIRANLFIFGFLFSAVSLLPYLPLGNITLRYAYLPSFGFIVMIIAVLDGIISKIVLEKQYNQYAYLIITLFVGTWCYLGLQAREKYWRQASIITENTVSTLHALYPFDRNTNLFFYRVPIKVGEAYVFPVGLPDAIYFINSDPTLRVFQVSNEAAAQSLAKSMQKKGTSELIFTFDKNNLLQEVGKK